MAYGGQALSTHRKSLPSLVMVSRDFRNPQSRLFGRAGAAAHTRTGVHETRDAPPVSFGPAPPAGRAVALKAATRRIVSILAQCASPACRRHCVRGMTHPPVRAAGDDGLIGIDLDEGAERSAERQYRPDPQGQAHPDHDDPRRGKGVRRGGVQRRYPSA